MRQIYKTIIILFIYISVLKGQEPDYFPMYIGYKWTYELWTGGYPNGIHWGDQVVEVTDTTVINDKKYFVFDDRIFDLFYEPGRVYQQTHYHRRSYNGDVMKFSECINDEQLYYTFQTDSLNRPYLYCGDLLPPKKWQITFLDTASVVNIPLGRFSDSYEYFFDIWVEGDVLPFLGRLLAPNIGLVEEGGEGDDNFLVGAYINGILIGDTTVTSVRELHQSEMLGSPRLYQNYPNPFNGLTGIPYSVPDFWTEPIRISIFNIVGREIFIFEPKELACGLFEVQWNGTDNAGKEVSSGLYFVKLRSGKFSQVIKVNFLK